MATLEQLRQEWAETHDQMTEDSSILRYDLTDIKEKIDAVEGPYRERLKQLEEAMRPLVTPDTPKVGHGVKIAHRREYKKVNWDSKMLDGYMVHDDKLRNFRKVITIDASTSFSRAKDD